MSLLQWKDQFALGVASMDKEHRDLVDAMNRVFELDQQQAGKQTVDGAIQRLMQLTVKHFQDEERHMEAIGFPDLQRHARIHADMLRQVGEHYAAFQKGDGRVAKSFFDFLVHWLAAHICHIDRKYADYGAPVAGKK